MISNKPSSSDNLSFVSFFFRASATKPKRVEEKFLVFSPTNITYSKSFVYILKSICSVNVGGFFMLKKYKTLEVTNIILDSFLANAALS